MQPASEGVGVLFLPFVFFLILFSFIARLLVFSDSSALLPPSLLLFVVLSSSASCFSSTGFFFLALTFPSPLSSLHLFLAFFSSTFFRSLSFFSLLFLRSLPSRFLPSALCFFSFFLLCLSGYLVLSPFVFWCLSLSLFFSFVLHSFFSSPLSVPFSVAGSLLFVLCLFFLFSLRSSVSLRPWTRTFLFFFEFFFLFSLIFFCFRFFWFFSSFFLEQRELVFCLLAVLHRTSLPRPESLRLAPAMLMNRSIICVTAPTESARLVNAQVRGRRVLVASARVQPLVFWRAVLLVR